MVNSSATPVTPPIGIVVESGWADTILEQAIKSGDLLRRIRWVRAVRPHRPLTEEEEGWLPALAQKVPRALLEMRKETIREEQRSADHRCR